MGPEPGSGGFRAFRAQQLPLGPASRSPEPEPAPRQLQTSDTSPSGFRQDENFRQSWRPAALSRFLTLPGSTNVAAPSYAGNLLESHEKAAPDRLQKLHHQRVNHRGSTSTSLIVDHESNMSGSTSLAPNNASCANSVKNISFFHSSHDPSANMFYYESRHHYHTLQSMSK
ncbi:Hypothetical predicted protein [Olea europaea subsp. europaea]|uniref:Uncharacterized protein n=1 Tax=Olea europaea subsp. europaea TaxID=158383 RepID=A0A8S0REH5_OLEEU|nr:Hypothetical predicted protein [Olea europaea subsp. europaea]